MIADLLTNNNSNVIEIIQNSTLNSNLPRLLPYILYRFIYNFHTDILTELLILFSDIFSVFFRSQQRPSNFAIGLKFRRQNWHLHTFSQTNTTFIPHAELSKFLYPIHLPRYLILGLMVMAEKIRLCGFGNRFYYPLDRR